MPNKKRDKWEKYRCLVNKFYYIERINNILDKKKYEDLSLGETSAISLITTKHSNLYNRIEA